MLTARTVVASLGWSELHTNTLLFDTNSAAELLNTSAEILVAYKSMGVLLSLSMGSGACALLGDCSKSSNSKFESVAVCQLSFSGNISLCLTVTYHLKHHFSVSETCELVPETSEHLREQEWIFTSIRTPKGLGRGNMVEGNRNRLDLLMSNALCPLPGGLQQNPWSHSPWSKLFFKKAQFVFSKATKHCSGALWVHISK